MKAVYATAMPRLPKVKQLWLFVVLFRVELRPFFMCFLVTLDLKLPGHTVNHSTLGSVSSTPGVQF